MKMEKDLLKLFNKQIRLEYESAFLYLSMSGWLAEKGYIGAANWMAVQYREEIIHAEGLIRYLDFRGEKFVISEMSEPKQAWDSLLNVFEEALAHEQLVTKNINGIVDKANDLKDHAAARFLDWYVLEQVEEEANAELNILKIERCEGDAGALIDFDNEMAERTFVADEIPHLD